MTHYYLVSGFHRAIKSVAQRKESSDFYRATWAVELTDAKEVLPWLLKALNGDSVAEMPYSPDGGSTYNQPLGGDLTPTQDLHPLSYIGPLGCAIVFQCAHVQAVMDTMDIKYKKRCEQYRTSYPNKRNGTCELSNTYGPHGCDLERTEFCQDGPGNLEICECRRCFNNGCDQTCPSFTEWGGSCKHQNSYGEHGCPECLD